MASFSFCVLGVHSFADAHRKTGIQHIAVGLGGLGNDVAYVSVPFSPFDIVGSSRWRRLRRAALHGGRRPILHPAPGVAEYCFFSPVPIHRLFFPTRHVERLVNTFLPWGKGTRAFDFCIHDVGPCMVYAPRIAAGAHVLRLNDAPGGFGEMPRSLRNALEERLANGFYRQIWAVSEPLAEYAASLAGESEVLLIPNGVSGELFAHLREERPSDVGNKAVYVGPNAPWVDLDLLFAAADLLPGWTFDIYGDGFPEQAPAGNVHFRGPLPHDGVDEVLARYAVGLLPYKDVLGRMQNVERPLKFYEYYAAGLGIASVDVGALRRGMGTCATYGIGPAGFAEAIEAAGNAPPPSLEDRRAFLAEHTWKNRLAQIDAALSRSRAVR